MSAEKTLEIIHKYALEIRSFRDEERDDIFYYSAFSAKEGGYHGGWRTNLPDAVESWAFSNDINLEAE